MLDSKVANGFLGLSSEFSVSVLISSTSGLVGAEVVMYVESFILI
jgi:hypothetical protein